MILTINDRNPDAHKIHKIADILRNDGVIVYPTDTSYGFACSIFSKKAQQRIFRLKQTDERKFLSLVCYDLSQVAEYAMMSNWAYRFLKSLLPGPYTIVMNATSKVPNYMHNKRKQIGVRMPDHPIARAIV
ncbi:MAG: threonylcarbamoyl-AMP synthase, partial [Deltaproteobacteria bacterium RIFOXYD2_FULL_66_9]